MSMKTLFSFFFVYFNLLEQLRTQSTCNQAFFFGKAIVSAFLPLSGFSDVNMILSFQNGTICLFDDLRATSCLDFDYCDIWKFKQMNDSLIAAIQYIPGSSGEQERQILILKKQINGSLIVNTTFYPYFTSSIKNVEPAIDIAFILPSEANGYSDYWLAVASKNHLAIWNVLNKTKLRIKFMETVNNASYLGCRISLFNTDPSRIAFAGGAFTIYNLKLDKVSTFINTKTTHITAMTQTTDYFVLFQFENKHFLKFNKQLSTLEDVGEDPYASLISLDYVQAVEKYLGRNNLVDSEMNLLIFDKDLKQERIRKDNYTLALISPFHILGDKIFYTTGDKLIKFTISQWPQTLDDKLCSCLPTMCQVCSKTQHNYCDTCFSGLKSFFGNCDTSCPGSESKTIPNLCCNTTCRNCTDNYKCSSCLDGYYLKDQNCIRCGPNCDKCLNSSMCVACSKDKNYNLTSNGTCLLLCETGLFLSLTTNKCEKCSENCLECNQQACGIDCYQPVCVKCAKNYKPKLFICVREENESSSIDTSLILAIVLPIVGGVAIFIVFIICWKKYKKKIKKEKKRMKKEKKEREKQNHVQVRKEEGIEIKSTAKKDSYMFNPPALPYQNR